MTRQNAFAVTEEQKIQEEEYERPYHHFVERASYFGNFYYSYIDTCAEIINSYSGKNVLDAGCGDGYFLTLLDEKKNELSALDFSERALAFAALFNEGRDIHFTLGRIQQMPFDAEQFDIVCSIAVFEHIPPAGVPECFEEVARVVKKGGFLILALPTHNAKQPAKHFQHFDEEQIKHLSAPWFTLKKSYPRYNKYFPLLLKFFLNRYYEVVPVSRWLQGKVFYKYFQETSQRNAKMMIYHLEKK
jgi:ubiquinone/menaquinone biosynthesis C-methylase UbiE